MLSTFSANDDQYCQWFTVLPLRRRDCDSIMKKVDYTQFMASRHRIVVALVGEAPLRTEGSTSRRL
jgi:hypothetical protein